jgi:hypothetical protein
MSSHAYDRPHTPLSISTLLFVVGGALITLALLALTGYLERRGYALARGLGMSLLIFVPGPFYSRLHPAWRARVRELGAAPQVGAATATAVGLGLVTALAIDVARDGIPIMTGVQALTLALFMTLVTLLGGWISTSQFRKQAAKRNWPPEATMSLRELLARPSAERSTRTGAPGIESEWSPLHDFHLCGSRIQLLDVMGAGKDDDGVIVRTRPGDSIIEGRTYGADRRLSRLRLRDADVADLVRRERIGTLQVSSGVLAICDVDRLASWAARDADDLRTWRHGLLQAVGDPFGDYPCEQAGTSVVFAATGFGAGTYEVFNLVSGSRVAGLEIEFIPFGTRCPG